MPKSGIRWGAVACIWGPVCTKYHPGSVGTDKCARNNRQDCKYPGAWGETHCNDGFCEVVWNVACWKEKTFSTPQIFDFCPSMHMGEGISVGNSSPKDLAFRRSLLFFFPFRRAEFSAIREVKICLAIGSGMFPISRYSLTPRCGSDGFHITLRILGDPGLPKAFCDTVYATLRRRQSNISPFTDASLPM